MLVNSMKISSKRLFGSLSSSAQAATKLNLQRFTSIKSITRCSASASATTAAAAEEDAQEKIDADKCVEGGMVWPSRCDLCSNRTSHRSETAKHCSSQDSWQTAGESIKLDISRFAKSPQLLSVSGPQGL
jgi:hypothetical protein